MLRLRTLGYAALFDGETRLDGPLAQHRRLALLSILAVAAPRAVSRDKVLALLWPDTGEENARHSLAQMLFLLRRDLKSESVIRGVTELSLDLTQVESDVFDFQDAIRRRDVASAVAVYHGPFLDEFHLSGSVEFSHWVDAQRERLAGEWRRALEGAARQRFDDGDLAGAAAAWKQLADAEPYDGCVAIELARALVAAGDRTGALAHLRVHTTLLAQDLEAEPGAEIAALIEELQRPVATIAPTAPTSHPVALVPETRRRTGRRLGRWLIAVVAVVAVAAVILRAVSGQFAATTRVLLTRHDAAPVPRRIVVAPLENRTGNADLDALGEMAADWIAQQLLGTGEFDVVDPRTSFTTARVVGAIPRLLRGDESVALARETRARYVLSGRYYRDADTLRVIVSVTDVGARAARRSIGPFGIPADAPAHGVTALAGQVVAAAAALVDTGAAGIIVAASAPPSYEAYREASHAWERYQHGDLPGVFAHAARATALDSTFMAPLAMEAYVRSEMRDWQRVASLVGTLQSHAPRLTPAERAHLELARAQLRGDVQAQLAAAQDLSRVASSATEVRTYVARVAVNANRPWTALATLDAVDPARGVMLAAPWYWDWRTAALHEIGDHQLELSTARRGMRQFPEDRLAILNVGRALAALGRDGQVRRLAASLPDGDRPGRAKVLLDWSRELRTHGRARAARELAGDVLKVLRGDSSVSALTLRVAALVETGRIRDASAAVDTMFDRGADEITAHGWAGALAAMQHDPIRAAVEDSVLAAGGGPYSLGRNTMWRARIAAMLGESDRALTLIERSLAAGHVRFFDPGGGPYDEPELHADPAFESLHGRRGFMRLLAPRR